MNTDGTGVFTIVLAGGEGKRLAPLTADRAKPAVPFGGNYRMIDFALSNLVNANYHRIVVLTQYKSHSLDRHVSTTWRLSPLLGNYVTPVPAQMRRGPRWFVGSADAIYQNFNLIDDERPEHIIVFGADHIYRMDPRQMVEQHIASRRGVTVAALRAPIEQADQFGVIETGADGRDIGAFREKPSDAKPLPDAPDQVFASMGNYVFSTDALVEALTADAADEDSKHDIGGDIIPMLVDRRGRRGLRLRRQRGARARRTATAATGATSAPWTPTTTRTWTSPRSSRSSISTTSAGRSTPGRTRSRPRSSSSTTRRRGHALDSMICAGVVVSPAARAPLDPLPARARCTPTRRSRTRSSCRASTSAAARSCAARSSTRTS